MRPGAANGFARSSGRLLNSRSPCTIVTTNSVLKIFLVENHSDTLAYLSAYLRSCGHEVECARDMDSALQRLEGRQIDVLISDIGLPDGDGWQLMEKVRAIRGHAPFGIAMSGYSMKADIEKSLGAGYRHHLVKPFVPDDLDVLLREAAGDGSN